MKPTQSYITAQQLASMILAAIGLGVGGRTAVGALWGMQKDREKRKIISHRRQLPHLHTDEVPKEDTDKSASDETALTKLRDSIADLLWRSPLFSKGQTWFGGRDATSFMETPAVGVGIPLALAALGGSWGLTDTALKRLQKRQEQKDVARLEHQYQELLNKTIQESQKKFGSVDALAAMQVKSASWIDPREWVKGIQGIIDDYPQWGGTITATALATAILLAYGTGSWVYDKNIKVPQHEIFNDARRLHDLRQLHGEGVPLYIGPAAHQQ